MAAVIAYLRGLRDPARRERLADRFGRPRLLGDGPVIWAHAASMGEVQAGAALVRRLLERYPRHRIVVTTMTATGAARVKALFPERVEHCYLPYDLPFAVQGFLARLKPSIALILETELWPTLLRACAQRAIPIVIASARISPRTAARYRRFAALFGASLKTAAIAAQTEADADRFKTLGAADVRVAGNLKFDFDVPAAVRDAGAHWRVNFAHRFVWVAGSTREGEEVEMLAAHRRLLQEQPSALLILAPRHPQRFNEVRALLAKDRWPFASRSRAEIPTASQTVFLIDALGELLHFYAAADVAFVGGSLVKIGGHNLLEPAALGAPVVSGPHLFNAPDVAERLTQAGALCIVHSGEELGAALIDLAHDAARRGDLGRRAAAVVTQNRGAVDRVMELIAARCAP